MLSTKQLDTVIGRTARTPEGDKIGKVSNIYIDDVTREPAFVAVHTGLFGMHESLVPAQETELAGDDVTVPFTKEKVKEAPHVDTDNGHISPEEERRIFDYDGLPYDVTPQHFDDAEEARHAAPRRETREPDDAMTRSEEHLRVGTRDEKVGRARLRKYVETEHVTETVPVRRERAVIEREPVTEGNLDRSLDGPEIAESEHEVVLHEERPVVEKRTEPVERVRLTKETDVDQETISDDVRRERIEAEGVDDTR